MSCHYGNKDCPDQSDTTHECRARPRAPEHERIARLMQRLAIAKANCHSEIVLDSDEIDTITEAFRVKALANGLAVLYDAAIVNPRLSQREAAIRGGAEVCARCEGAITPSNRAIHETGNCWPRWTA